MERTWSRESLVGRRKSYGVGSPRRDRPPGRRGEVGTPTGALASSAGALGTALVTGASWNVTSTPIGRPEAAVKVFAGSWAARRDPCRWCSRPDRALRRPARAGDRGWRLLAERRLLGHELR